MDLQKEREAFERHKFKDQYDELKACYDEREREHGYRYPSYTYDDEWETWLAAKNQASKQFENFIDQAIEDSACADERRSLQTLLEDFQESVNDN